MHHQLDGHLPHDGLFPLGEGVEKNRRQNSGKHRSRTGAIVFDWDSYQALEMCIGPNKDLRYVPEVWRFYDALYRRHIPVDFIPADAGVDKLAAYPLVLCPVLYMVQGDTAERLAAYVRQGGTLVTGYMSGMADGNDRIYTGGYPGGCRTNVRQLILYIQHKTPSFEKPGVRGIISLCN